MSSCKTVFMFSTFGHLQKKSEVCLKKALQIQKLLERIGHKMQTENGILTKSMVFRMV